MPLRFTCDEKKIWENIKKSQVIMRTIAEYFEYVKFHGGIHFFCFRFAFQVLSKKFRKT